MVDLTGLLTMLKIIILFIILIYCIQSSASTPNYLTTYFKLDKLQFSVDLYFKDCPHLTDQFNNWDQILQSESTCWNGPYIRNKDTRDSYNNTILIKRNSASNIVFLSLGSDQIFNTKDDISSADSIEKRRSVRCYYQTRNQYFIKKIFCLYPTTTGLIILIVILSIALGIKNR